VSQPAEAHVLPAGVAEAPERDRPSEAEIRAAWQRPEVLFPAAVLAVVTLLQLGLSARGLIGAGFVATLVVLGAIDLRHRLIPNRIVLPAAAAVLLLQITFYPEHAVEWIAASLGAALFLFIPLVLFPAGIGMGDVKLALLLGAMLGRDVLPALVLGFLSLWPVAIYLFATQGWSARRQTLPLGPSLAFGAIVVLLLGG
jgi:leader peptidase (prepilin peptidase) / N-methyltransferase